MSQPPRKAEVSGRDKTTPHADEFVTPLVEQYKIYIEMMDRLSARRVLVNNSFITLMGAGAFAYTVTPQYFPGGLGVLFQLGTTVICMLLAGMWWSTITYYRTLSTAKFKVINEIEDRLPAQPFRMEWQLVEEAAKSQRRRPYKGQSIMEMRVPVIAGVLSCAGFLITASIQLPEVVHGKVPLVSNCAQAAAHWKSAEDIKSLAVYKDHLARFPNCEFAGLASARIEAVTK